MILKIKSFSIRLLDIYSCTSSYLFEQELEIYCVLHQSQHVNDLSGVNKKPEFVKSVWRGFGELLMLMSSKVNQEYKGI